MSLIKRMRRQAAVYWEKKSAPADEFGTRDFEAPVEIKCRWEDKDGEVRNKEGEILNSAATVYVDREVKVGDKLKFGSVDSETPDDPLGDPEAYDVIGFEKTPNLKARENLLVAYL